MDHDYRDVPMVRQRAELVQQPDMNVAKIKVRIDFYPHLGELDYSLIAWHHPMGVLIKNEVWSHYDKWHVGMAAQDVVAHVYDILREVPEPF